MATYDNKHWLLSNIRSSFIATHTGFFDNVMAGENYPKILCEKSNQEKEAFKPNAMKDSQEEDELMVKELVTEFDPYPDMEEGEDDLDIGSYIRYEDLGAHRQRSDTALWLEKKDHVMRKASKMKIIKWEDPLPLTKEERQQLFPRKEISNTEECNLNAGMKSLLTEQLKHCPHMPHHKYLEYAKFDGTGQIGLSTKTFKIFMTILPEALSNYPVVVCVISTAKIQDLIGFTCYKYSIEHKDIVLGTVQSYGLCIAEDDGEVDDAFPCLDANEPCSKFNFNCLGLVELKTKTYNHVSSSIPEDGLKGFPSRSITMASTASELIEQQHKDVPNTFTQSRTISSLDQDMCRIEAHRLDSEAPQYKSYRVVMYHKYRSKVTVQLGISMDSIEIEPLYGGSHRILPRMKPISYSVDIIGWCNIIEAKSNNNTLFRIKYSQDYKLKAGGDSNITPTSPQSVPTFKSREFECEHAIAKEIVDKINRILDLRSSPCRRDYKAAKERKLQTRRSFHIPKHNISFI